jgi:RecB family exonuclease
MVKWDERIKLFCKKDFKLRENKKSFPERKIEFTYQNIKLAARVDRIDINENEVVLIDYKTSKDALKKEKYPYELQTTFYYLWAKENFSNKEIKTYIWDVYNGKLVEGVIKEEILKEALKNLPKSVKESQDIIIDEKVVKKAADICRFCPYTVACGRDL